MKNLTTISIKQTIMLLLVAACGLGARAQKLPNIQPETGVRAPADINIDGKTTEWSNRFKAYNRATDVFYTISNDDENLYLTLQATDPSVINKILKGGVAFAINATGKRNDKGMPSITYPVFDAKNRPGLGINKKSLAMGGAVTLDNVSDSMVTVYNRVLKERSKLVEVTGITGIDTLISVYNNEGIRTAELYDSKMAYTYELAISLKLLNLSAKDATKLAYHITLSSVSPVTLKAGENGDRVVVAGSAPHSEILDAKISAELTQLGQANAPTDFWGEYVLAGK